MWQFPSSTTSVGSREPESYAKCCFPEHDLVCLALFLAVYLSFFFTSISPSFMGYTFLCGC